jgi:excisionase family DNA binding protein
MKEIIKYQEAADYLCVSVPTLRRWVSLKKIEFHKVGISTVVFFKSELDAFIHESDAAHKRKMREK